jgi:hypothetical protein
MTVTFSLSNFISSHPFCIDLTKKPTLYVNIFGIQNKYSDGSNSFAANLLAWGVVYSYAAVHPKVILEARLPASVVGKFSPPSRGGLWWILFHMVPDLAEKLVACEEQLYL